jgi:hypothetical protein
MLDPQRGYAVLYPDIPLTTAPLAPRPGRRRNSMSRNSPIYYLNRINTPLLIGQQG